MRPASKPDASAMRGQPESGPQRPAPDPGSAFTNFQPDRGSTVALSHTRSRTESCADASLRSAGGYFGTSDTLASAVAASTTNEAAIVSTIGAPWRVAI